MQKNLGILVSTSKSCTYLPTKNLRILQTPGYKTDDSTPRYNNDNQNQGKFGNQRTMTVGWGKGDSRQSLSKLIDRGHGGRIDEQEWKHISVTWAKIQEVSPTESSSTDTPLGTGTLP
ncbi:hypothetical protein Tco_0004392 [Tanacetum coccineum]